MINNLNKHPDLKWQYYGDEEGVTTIYPANKICNKKYDPRFRPWYAQAATPVKKDIILMIDVSGKTFYIFSDKFF